MMKLCLAGLAVAGTRPALAQMHASATPPPPAELARRLEGLADSLARAGRFSGVVLLAQGDQVIYQHGYGLADHAAGRPIDLETRFNLGSINKMFTSIAIRQLEAAGRIDLDSTIAAYWPDYPNPDVAHRVTVRQLLSHRAGLSGDIFGTQPARGNLRRLRDFLPLFVHDSLEFAPGSRYQYCNACYVVLGLLVERISGEDYYNYVRTHIYEPAGMKDTGHYPSDSLPPNTAIGYTNGRTDTVDIASAWASTDSLPRRGSSAGGGYSTAGDLLRFARAAGAGRIPGGPASGHVGYAGGAAGTNAYFEYGIPGDYTLIVLANLDPPAAFQVAMPFRGWLGLPSQ